MITSFEELGEVLAEFENRLSYLENSQTSLREPKVAEPQQVEHIVRHSDMSKQDFDELRRLKREVEYLKGKKKETYTIEGREGG